MSYAALRTIHGTLALAFAALLALYAASGWLIIHRSGGEAPQERSLRVPAERIRSEDGAKRAGAIALAAAARAGLAGARVESARREGGEWRVSLARVARTATVTLMPDSETAGVALRNAGFVEGVRRLHRVNATGARDARLLWVVGVDALSIALLLFSLTGVWLFLRLKRDRRLGWLALGAGTLYTLGSIAWLALSR